MVTYRPPSFDLRELVPKATFEALGDKAWDLLDKDILKAAQAVRDLVGPCEVNTWHKGGQFQFRGYRPPDCPVGAKGSMHKQGKAIDLFPLKMTPEGARELIRKHAYKGDLRLIRRMERKVNWVHIDTKLAEFDP